MDNGGSHKSKEIKNKIAESRNHLLYSVPYRPKTNAIESFFLAILCYLHSNLYFHLYLLYIFKFIYLAFELFKLNKCKSIFVVFFNHIKYFSFNFYIFKLFHKLISIFYNFLTFFVIIFTPFNYFI